MKVCNFDLNSFAYPIKDASGIVVKTVTFFGRNKAAELSKNKILMPFAYTEVDPADWDAVMAQYGKHNYHLKRGIIFAEKTDVKTIEKSQDEELQNVPTGSQPCTIDDLDHRTQAV